MYINSQNNQFNPQPLQQPYREAPKPKSKLKKILLIIGLLIFAGALGLGYLFFQGVKDAPKVKTNIGSFLQSVSTGDFSSAYSLTSTEFQKTLSPTDFNNAMKTFEAQYSSIKDQQQTGFSVNTSIGQPTQYKYSGVITYDNGDKGELSAILIKESGEWKIHNIEINIDVKRMQKFQQQNQDSVLGVSTSK